MLLAHLGHCLMTSILPAGVIEDGLYHGGLVDLCGFAGSPIYASKQPTVQ
jgi:hypothetical protein